MVSGPSTPAPASVFRFAPSPNGELHLGHAFSAVLDHRMARSAGGRFLLRLEDIDAARCTPAFEAGILDDLRFLGLGWDGEPRRQSEHFGRYRAVLADLEGRGLIYPAFLTRGEVRAHALRHAARSGEPWPRDPDGAPLYPGLDRDLGAAERRARIASGAPFAWRLDMARAASLAGALDFVETGDADGGGQGAHRTEARPELWGDVVLGRKDVPASYHLAVVLDDADQGVTNVVRGRDLFEATGVHRVLQALLGLPAPVYHHHRLIRDAQGAKLSKSRGAPSLRSLRAKGARREDILAMVGLSSEAPPISRG
jgi:glutamyl-Q tRNA(Asp) synthetase